MANGAADLADNVSADPAAKSKPYWLSGATLVFGTRNSMRLEPSNGFVGARNHFPHVVETQGINIVAHLVIVRIPNE